MYSPAREDVHSVAMMICAKFFHLHNRYMTHAKELLTTFQGFLVAEAECYLHKFVKLAPVPHSNGVDKTCPSYTPFRMYTYCERDPNIRAIFFKNVIITQ